MSTGQPRPRWIIGATHDDSPLVRTAPCDPPPFVEPRYRIVQPYRIGVPEVGARPGRIAREPPIAVDIDAARFIATTLHLFETEVLVVQVAPRVLGDRGEAPALVAAFHARFRRTIVLVAQDGRGVPTYFGPGPIAAVLAKIPFDAFAWRRYRYRRPRPQMLPIPIDPLPSYTSDAWSEPGEQCHPDDVDSGEPGARRHPDDVAKAKATMPGRKREQAPLAHRRTLHRAAPLAAGPPRTLDGAVGGRRTLDAGAPSDARRTAGDVFPTNRQTLEMRRTRTLDGVAPPPADRVLDEDRTVPRPRQDVAFKPGVTTR